MTTTTTKSLDALTMHLRKWFPDYAIHLKDIMPDDAHNVVTTLEQIEGFKYDDGYMPFIAIGQGSIIKALDHMLSTETISQIKYDEYIKLIEPIDWEVFVYSFH